jgi:hypothetical protein
LPVCDRVPSRGILEFEPVPMSRMNTDEMQLVLCFVRTVSFVGCPVALSSSSLSFPVG